MNSIVSRFGIGILIVALVAIGIQTFRVSLLSADLKDERAARVVAEAEGKALSRALASHEAASIERAADNVATRQLEKDMHDAVKDLPDALPSDRRVARACAQLRAQGTDTADLTACS